MTEPRSQRGPVDAIVVGSGAAGSFAAKTLTEGGLNVLLLEAGRAIDERADFPQPPPAARPLVTRASAALAGQSVQMRCPAFDARRRRFFVDDRENPYTTARGEPFNWFRGRQVGGRLHAWGRVALRLTNRELRGASHDGHGIDWPLDASELEPYYDEIERFLGLESIAPMPLERAFAAAVESRFPGRRVVSPRLVRHDAARIPAALRAAGATGRLTLKPDSVVERVNVDPASGLAAGVAVVDRATRRRSEHRAPLVVLCASTIETLRILLNSACPSHPGGLGNSSGLLGRGLMDHVLVGVGGPVAGSPAGLAEAGADPYDFGRVTGLSIRPFRNATEPASGFVRTYSIQGAVGRAGPTWHLLAHGEMLARPENAVTLDPRRRDAFGIPAARVRCVPSENERALALDALAVLHELAGAAGLRVRMPPSGGPLARAAYRLWRPRLESPWGAFLPGSAIHETGGAPLGADPATSVLDPEGRCWDAPNVVVADGACFPSGCWQNVTLTIMALAVRASRAALRRSEAGTLDSR